MEGRLSRSSAVEGSCYKSETWISPESDKPFIKGIIKEGHESVLEMAQTVLEIEVDSEFTMHKFFERIPTFFSIILTY
jgi:thymidylate synthase ThyX